MIRLFITGALLYLLLATSALAQSPAPVKLAWMHSTDNVAVTGYNIYRDGKKIGSSPTTSYTDTTVAPTTQYSYTVSAFDAAGNESDTSAAYVIKTGTIIILPPGDDHTFTLCTGCNTYYLATATDGGSDANTGLDITHPWLTPNHAMKCGEVILVKASASYSAANFAGNFGAVSNCPSTTGGIDGSGGVYFANLVCAGTFVGACAIANSASPPLAGLTGALIVDNNNWSIQGWKVSTSPSSGSQPVGFLTDGRAATPGGPFVHHVAFINNISTNTGMGFATADGGSGTVPGNGVDQWAVVGNIAHNSNQWQQCIGAIDDAGPANFDSSAGTHVFVSGNFVMNNQQTFRCTNLPDPPGGDGEAIFFDTWDAHNYTGQGVISDNVTWTTERFGVAVFFQNSHGAYSGSTIKIYNNTSLAANLQANSGNSNTMGTMNIGGNPGNTAWPFPTTIANNIMYETVNTNAAGTALYALQITYSQSGTWAIGGTGSENLFKANQSSCNNTAAMCDAGFNIRTDVNPYTTIVGANFFEDPLFANASDLTTNWIGTPNCSSFTNVTACMGWNHANQTRTTLTPVADIVPSSAHSAGKGYTPPQTACLTSGARFNDYPAYLKGVVYLQASGFVNGATITEKAGLINKPCNK